MRPLLWLNGIQFWTSLQGFFFGIRHEGFHSQDTDRYGISWYIIIHQRSHHHHELTGISKEGPEVTWIWCNYHRNHPNRSAVVLKHGTSRSLQNGRLGCDLGCDLGVFQPNIAKLIKCTRKKPEKAASCETFGFTLPITWRPISG